MKIKKEFSVLLIDGKNTVVSEDKNFATVITLGDVATYLFKQLKDKDLTKEQLFNGIIKNFNVSTVLALSDLDIFIKLMKENDIIE